MKNTAFLNEQATPKEPENSMLLNVVEKVANVASWIPHPITKGVGIAATLGIAAYKANRDSDKGKQITDKYSFFKELAGTAVDVVASKIPGGGYVAKAGGALFKAGVDHKLEKVAQAEYSDADIDPPNKPYKSNISKAWDMAAAMRNKAYPPKVEVAANSKPTMSG